MIGAYERAAQRLLAGIPKAKPCGVVINGRLCTGNKSLHRTKQAVRWRLFWRIKFKNSLTG